MEDNIKTERDTGWIILAFVLTLIIIGLIIGWIITALNTDNIPAAVCYGPYGVQLNTDGTALNVCGTSQDQSCTFRMNTIADCEAECTVLQDICQAFSFNPLTATMKIVNIDSLFVAPQTNLFIRQAGQTL